MDEQKKEMIEGEGKSPLFKGLVVLLCSIFLTLGLYFYNYFLNESILSTTGEISKIDNSINILKKDKGIQVYNLVDLNKTVLADLDKKSKINDFIYHIRSLEQTYGILFKGFNYNNGTVSLQATSPFGTNASAANKVSVFIKSYRENTKNPFELAFINSFVGFDTINFNVNLKLK